MWYLSLCITPSHLSGLWAASLLTLRASTLESNLANSLPPEICLSEQDFTVAVTFQGACLRGASATNASVGDFLIKQYDSYVLEPRRTPCVLMGLRAAAWKQLECVGLSGLCIPCPARTQHLAVPQGFCPVTSPLPSRALAWRWRIGFMFFSGRVVAFKESGLERSSVRHRVWAQWTQCCDYGGWLAGWWNRGHSGTICLQLLTTVAPFLFCTL